MRVAREIAKTRVVGALGAVKERRMVKMSACLLTGCTLNAKVSHKIGKGDQLSVSTHLSNYKH